MTTSSATKIKAYETSTEVLSIGQLAIELTYVTNADELLNQLIEQAAARADDQEPEAPYWAELWHSAIGLANYLAEQDIIRPGSKVTEIGCGLGLPGIVAARLGAEVILTDYLPEPLDFLQKNWSRNLSTPLRIRRMDWRVPDSDLGTEILLASDVAYEARFFPELERAFTKLLPHGGRILLSEPSRQITLPFVEQLATHPAYTLRQQVIPITWDNYERQVRILDIKVAAE